MTPEPVAPVPAPAPAPSKPEGLPPPPPSRRRRLLKGFLIFLLGVAFGAALVTGVLWRHYLQGARNPVLARERVLRWLDRRLDLDAAQEARVKEIVRIRHEELLRLRDAAVSDVDAVLNEAQRAKWRAFLEAWKPR